MSVKEKMTAIADRIRTHLLTEDKYSLSDMPQAIDDVFLKGDSQGIEQGRQAEYDEFWDRAQTNGERHNYDYFFAGGGWTRTNAKPKYKIYPTSTRAMFERNNNSSAPIQTLEDLGVEVDFSRCSDLVNTFANSGFKYISKLTAKSGSYANMSGCFQYCTQLEKIGEFKVTTSSISTSSTNGISFPNCTKLKEIYMSGTIGAFFNAGACPLIKDSIVNIIEHLADNVSGKTLTLKKTAVNEAFPYICAASYVSNVIVDDTGWESVVCALGIGDDVEVGEYVYISFENTNMIIKKKGDSILDSGDNEGQWELVAHGADLKDEWGDLVASKSNWNISLV